MAIAWTIKGEAGKAVDETAHTLPELQAEGAVVTFASLAADRLTWTIKLGATTEGADIIPDRGQKITLYRDGARFFTGNVTGRKRVVRGGELYYNITVEGPWWWLRNMPLSAELADQRGEDFKSERAAYVFPTGSVTDHLQGLITRAIALGAPITAGSIATCFNIPRLSLRNISFAEAISDVMRWMADGIVYVDYSGDDEDAPALCMQRRPTATTLTITPSAGIFPEISVEERVDLKVSELRVVYATHSTVDNKRLVAWAVSDAGTSNPDLPARQLVLVSGPEQDTYLPQDFTDAVVVRSAPISGNLSAIIATKDDRIRAAGETAEDFSVGAYDDDIFTMPSITTQITDTDGNPLPAGYNYWLVAGESKDWWAKDGIEYIPARLAATLYSSHTEELPLPESPYDPPKPAWYEVIGGTVVGGYPVPDPARMRWVWWTTVSVPFIAVKTHWTTDTTLIRSEDYSFINPPEDLAENLLATQNWLPHEGVIVQDADPDMIPAGHYVGAKVNVMEVDSDLETMGALVVEQSISLRTGRISYRLGAPARLAFRDLVNRFRQSGADNIVWLNGTTPLSNPEGAGAPVGNQTLNEDGQVELTEAGETTVDEG
jgi:hypothetical protein